MGTLGHALSVHYLQGKIGPQDGGAEWFMPLGKRADDLYIAYRLRFGVGFDFVKGGKLPGLGGGANNTGGHKPNGDDGWSARMMWRTGGHAVQYVYHPDQPGVYGEDFAWRIGGEPVVFVPGRWYHVEHRIVMNTPGQKDGVIQGWLDGQLALEKRGLRFRNTAAFAIDTLQFSTFFGGGDPSWAASRDEEIAFDDLRRCLEAPSRILTKSEAVQNPVRR